MLGSWPGGLLGSTAPCLGGAAGSMGTVSPPGAPPAPVKPPPVAACARSAASWGQKQFQLSKDHWKASFSLTLSPDLLLLDLVPPPRPKPLEQPPSSPAVSSAVPGQRQSLHPLSRLRPA